MNLFPDVLRLRLLSYQQEASQIHLTLQSDRDAVSCPDCGTLSRRLHSHYQRSLSDLPLGPFPLCIHLQVRRFFCDHRRCPRRTFAESFPELALPHAQRSLRLQAQLQQIALSVGGQAGARLARMLHVPASADTLLRLLRTMPIPAPQVGSAIGIDDWAIKKGQQYGTLICDLHTHRPLDVLPDRSQSTVQTWLQQQPQVQIVSRDRANGYAAAITQGAPTAVQVADRWHVLHNLHEQVLLLLRRHHDRLPYRDYERPIPAVDPDASVPDAQALLLLAQASQAPVGASRRPIAPYLPYLAQRWQQGCRNGHQLSRELQPWGYSGSLRAVNRELSRYVEGQRRDPHIPHGPRPQARTHWSVPLSASQASWVLWQDPEHESEAQRQEHEAILAVDPEIRTTDYLLHAWQRMLKSRDADALSDWLKQTRDSAIGELVRFAVGVQQDREAVQAGIRLPYNNGLLEGHVNRLKTIKRSMYGRASFDLLRQRVLLSSA